MNQLLMVIASLLGIISLVVFFVNLAGEEKAPRSEGQKEITALLVFSGLLIGFGGFWVAPMTWIGFILMELGCLIYSR